MNNRNHTTLFAVLIVIMIVVNYSIFNKIVTDKVPAPSNDVSQDGQAETAEERAQRLLKEDIANNFVDLTVSEKDTKCGQLVMVNPTHAFDFEASTTLFEHQQPQCVYDSKTGDYYVKDRTVLLNEVAINALNQMLADFKAQTGHEDIMIVDGHRTFEWQQLVLDTKIEELGEEEGRRIATQPGYSEHHTGLALDLTLYVDGVRQTYDGTGDYQWITDNCYKYGFIIRYPENKTEITQINYEPWHLRYVGFPHAEFMTKNGICFEEYINMLSNYPINSARLSFTSETGAVYQIYSCSASGDSPVIKVPKNANYELSGDNSGHIIVTVEKSGAVASDVEIEVNSDTASEVEAESTNE